MWSWHVRIFSIGWSEKGTTAMTLQEFLPWSGTAQAIGAMVHQTHICIAPEWREVVCGQLFRSEYAARENVRICVLASARGLLTLPNEGAPGGWVCSIPFP
jgi:hypothetical protein